MNKAEAMRAYLDMLSERVELTGQLRKLKAEKRAMFRVFRGYHLYCQECRMKCIPATCPLLKGKVKR